MGNPMFIKLLNLLLLLSLCMKLPSIYSAQVTCKERERQALLKFKHDVTDRYGVLSSWGDEEDKKECCEWKGVTCSNRTGHVISLDLRASVSDDGYYFKSLTGKVTPALVELRHLHYLDLTDNDFGGSEIPRFIGSLTKLRALRLSNSNFTREVPREFGNLTNLKTLNLSGNYGARVENLDWLPRLSSLSYLDLSNFDLANQSNWLKHMTKLPFLKELYLLDCRISDSLPSFDIFANSSLPSLSILALSDNNLTLSFPFHQLFNITPSLTYIDLGGNPLDGQIPDAFGKLSLLEELYLYDNKFNGGIPRSLGNLTRLRLLSISGNRLNVPLPRLFQNISGRALQSIDLSYNRLFGPLPDITRFSSLVWMTLRNNYLSGFLPQSIGRPSSLQSLYLSYNNISGSLPDMTAFSSLSALDITANDLKRLDGSIWKLSKLVLLYASSNLLEGTITEANLSNLVNLQVLDFSSNPLTFDIRPDWVPTFQIQQIGLSHCNVGPHFPNWLQTQHSLVKLYMSFAGILDELPSWLWNMSSMQYLDLSHNNISGRIPNFSSKSVFEVMDLRYNKLSGRIPSSVYHSRQVQLSNNLFSGSIYDMCTISDNFISHILDFSDNQLAEELPDCWTNKTSLVVLDLANNNFSGKIPSSFGALSELQVIRLRNNNFTGELPLTLRNCSGLRMLDVGGNKLRGNIPEWIGIYLTSLIVLSLRYNEFRGSIPPTICHLKNIQVLDFSRNNISGRIPGCWKNMTALVQKNISIDNTSFEYRKDRFWYEFAGIYVNNALVQWKGQEFEYTKLEFLKGLDLSSNELVGTIPGEFSNLRGLVFLNLSRNHLTGNIISNIGQMETLESFDLSQNNLSGNIPDSLANLNFLSVLNLSYNNLTGKIPLSTQLQSFDSSAYAGNSQLCGVPLPECPWESPKPSSTDRGKDNVVEEDDGLITRGFYISMAFGFITGFWAVVGTLILKDTWRYSYFNFWNRIGEWMCLKTTMYVTTFKRKYLA